MYIYWKNQRTPLGNGRIKMSIGTLPVLNSIRAILEDDILEPSKIANHENQKYTES